MREYRYEIDRKVTTWYKEYHTVEAKNQKEADKIAVEIAKKIREQEADEYEDIIDATTEMEPSDNEGYSTVEVTRDGKKVWENGKSAL